MYFILCFNFHSFHNVIFFLSFIFLKIMDLLILRLNIWVCGKIIKSLYKKNILKVAKINAEGEVKSFQDDPVEHKSAYI